MNDLICPADGKISQLGQISEGEIFQAKGHHFSVQDLLGIDPKQADVFKEGSFLTVYLAPPDYHRVHMPMDAHLTQMIYIPGRLFSVNFKTASRTPNLFARNERVVTLFETSVGKMAVILVGAMIVGSMETVFAGTITPPRRKELQKWNYEHPIHFRRGEELGRFKLGSTVIVLFEREKIVWDPCLKSTRPVKMGEKLGIIRPDRW